MKKIEELKAALSVAWKIAKELDDHEHHGVTGLLGTIRWKALSALQQLEQHQEWLKENPEPEKQPPAAPAPAPGVSKT